MRQSFVFQYDIPIYKGKKRGKKPETFGGRVIGYSVKHARKLLRIILKVRALPRWTQVFQLA